MSDGWLGFIGGTLAALVAALLASMTMRHFDRAKRKQQAQLDFYFHLLDLNNWYFWVTVAELHGEEPKPEVLEACRRIALQLNDKLRSFEDVAYLDDILSVLFSEAIPTAKDRAQRLDALLDGYGRLLNPKYTSTVRRISNENLLRYRHVSGGLPPFNAPGSWSYRK